MKKERKLIPRSYLKLKPRTFLEVNLDQCGNLFEKLARSIFEKKL